MPAARLRVIGDVHAQIEETFGGGDRTYLDLISGCSASVQLGDMGDEEAYSLLIDRVDPVRHRFFPGNHDHHGSFPPHCLGDFGAVNLGGVSFFFIRGAMSRDRDELIQRGKWVGRKLWYEEEELTTAEMTRVEVEYRRLQPKIVITHDGPTRIARFAFENASRQRVGSAGAEFASSRTTSFLERLLDIHRPRLWLFGHHHYDWRYSEDGTTFVCVGELSFVDIDESGCIVESTR